MLTEEQEIVANHKVDVAVVQACAGSGKTHTMIERCKRLEPSHTKLVLAFNKKAADEFQNRLGRAPQTIVKTFHSFCLQLIRNNYKSFGFEFAPTVHTDSSVFRQMVIANEAPQEWKKWEDAEEHWDERYVMALEHSVYTDEIPNMMLNLESTSMEFKTLKAVHTYRKWLNEINILTFDSMIRIVAEKIHNIPYIADHVIVDEFQDVDRFQLDIIRGIYRFKKPISLAVVGDVNQTIYEWRGAISTSFEEIGGLSQDTAFYSLTTNFRSYDGILDMANEVFSINPMKGVRGESKDCAIYGGIEDLLENHQGKDYSDCAILSRYNRDCGMWKIKLARQDIPTFTIGGGSFWTLKHIQIAKRAWDKKQKESDVFTSKPWSNFIKTKKCRDDADFVKECEQDVKWLLNLSFGDMRMLQDNLQNEREGLRLSTIHKTKGMEFTKVLLSSVDQRLKDDSCLYYVALTRAKDLLVIG